MVPVSMYVLLSSGLTLVTDLILSSCPETLRERNTISREMDSSHSIQLETFKDNYLACHNIISISYRADICHNPE